MGSEHSIRYQYMPDASWHGSLDQMKQILKATEPGKVSAAGAAYNAAAEKFQHTAEVLRRELPKLREAWTGKVAEEAIGKLEKLLRQADTMHVASSNIGASLTDHGEKLNWYANEENQPGPGMFAGVDWGDVAAFTFGGLVGLGAKKAFMDDAEDKAATEFMTRLSGRTLEANNMMPANVTSDIPAFGSLSDFNPDASQRNLNTGAVPGGGGPNGGLPSFQDSMGSGGGGAGGTPKVPPYSGSDPYGNGGAGSGGGGAGGGGGIGNPPNGIGGIGNDGGGVGNGGAGSGGAGTGGGGRLPSGVGGIGSDGGSGLGNGLPGGIGNADPYGSPGSRLASATPNLPGAGLDGLGPGGGGAGGGGMSGFGGGAGGGGLGSGSGLASNGFGPGGAMGAGAGAGRGFGAGGTAAGAGGRGAGMPMGGGGHGRGEEERERSTWLTEDEDVWGGDADTAPPVIG